MKQARVVNLTRGTVLAEQARVADSFVTRFLGLMGRAPLAPGAGLVLIPGGAVHNFFVRQTLDVLHLTEGGRVTHVVAGLKPWRLGPLGVGGAVFSRAIKSSISFLRAGSLPRASSGRPFSQLPLVSAW